MELKGKTAIVTGSARGIGAGMAVEFGRAAVGLMVILAGSAAVVAPLLLSVLLPAARTAFGESA